MLQRLGSTLAEFRGTGRVARTPRTALLPRSVSRVVAYTPTRRERERVYIGILCSVGNPPAGTAAVRGVATSVLSRNFLKYITDAKTARQCTRISIDSGDFFIFQGNIFKLNNVLFYVWQEELIQK